jgi:transposase
MGKPHPMALRERVAAFVDEGNSNREASRHFRVSPKFVNDLLKLRAETGSLEPRRQGHGPGGGKLAGHVGFVRQRLEENGDLTLDELCVELAGRGVTVHRSNVGRLLDRLGLSHKKRRFKPASRSGRTSGTRANTGPGDANPSSTRL